MTHAEGVVMAKPLSRHTNSTGSSQTAARFSASISMPWFIAPSPKNATATLPGRRCWCARAKPQAAGPAAPTMPEEAARWSFEYRCMWPPMPPHRPSAAPMHSFTIAAMCTPRRSMPAVPR